MNTIKGSGKVTTNGINGATGQYDVQPIALEDLARQIKGIPTAEIPEHVVKRGSKLRQSLFAAGLPWGFKSDDLTRVGWAIVFHTDESPEVRQALRPLIEHRRAQVGNDALLKELDYISGEDATTWLVRSDVSWHGIEPTKVPFYLLWIGPPQRIPYEVTHEIDSDYCVGLLDFDTPQEYAAYAAGVIAYETKATVENSREAVFFGTRHPFDEATQLSADWLVTPIAEGTPGSSTTPAVGPIATSLGFRQRTLIGPAATRDALLQTFDATRATPSLLFTASHGMVWPNGDARQFISQGALLCQDWPGFGSVSPAHFVTGADISDNARVHGLITFHFACFGGGTPARDLYSFERGQAPPEIAPKAFTAALPRRLLAHPGGGALACIAHVERAWGSSITGIGSSPQIRQFQRAVGQILVGQPVGLAVQEFNDMSATLSEVLSGLQGKVFQGIPVDDLALARAWMQRNDAAGFVLLGDPAVRLRITDLV